MYKIECGTQVTKLSFVKNKKSILIKRKERRINTEKKL